MTSAALDATLEKLTANSADPAVLNAVMSIATQKTKGEKATALESLLKQWDGQRDPENDPYSVEGGITPDDWKRFGADKLVERLIRLIPKTNNDEELEELNACFGAIFDAVCEGTVAARGNQPDEDAIVRIEGAMTQIETGLTAAEESVGITNH